MSDPELLIGLVSISDRASSGVYEDKGIPALREWFGAALATPWKMVTRLIPDQQAGIERTFKILNTANLPLGVTSTKAGGGIQVGLNGEIFKGFRLITTNYWSDGGGRYLFGQAPDAIVRADGTISPLHAGGTVDGFEAKIKNLLLYSYYGGIYVGKNIAIDTNGKPVGYGFVGSSQNKAIQEITFGFNQTLWANPRYGAINLMGQYEWLDRAPWYFASTSPESAHDNTIYINLRYTLPGSMPNF